jgi:hypothetical protein
MRILGLLLLSDRHLSLYYHLVCQQNPKEATVSATDPYDF